MSNPITVAEFRRRQKFVEQIIRDTCDGLPNEIAKSLPTSIREQAHAKLTDECKLTESKLLLSMASKAIQILERLK